MKKLKVGIIGCGGIANQKHFPALSSQADKCEMTAFCDIIEERAKTACEKYGEEEFLVKIPETRRVLSLMEAVRRSAAEERSVNFEA